MTDNKFADAPESKLHFLDYWRIIRIRKTLILLVFGLVVVTATAVTFLLKPAFASTVRIAVEKESTDVTSPLANQQMAQPYDPFWLQTQFEIIQSRKILNEVILRLELTRKWTEKYSPEAPLKPDETYLLLRNKMKVRQSRNTSLIEITIQTDTPEEAALIANTIAEVYQAARLEDRRKMKLGGVKALEKRLEEKNTEVTAAQQYVYEMRKTNDIAELEGAFMVGGGTTVLENDTLRRIEQLRIESQATYEEFNTLLEKILLLSREELRGALVTIMPNPDTHLISLSISFSEAQRKLTALLQEQGREHPQVKQAQADVDNVEQQLDARVGSIIEGLRTKVASAKKRLDWLSAEVQSARTKQADTADKHRSYFEAKRDLENLIQVRNALKLKIDAEVIEANLPITTAVKVWDEAVPVYRPVKPNKPLNIALGVIVGLIVGVGLAFFIEYLDTSVKTIDDVERALQAPVLAVIPQNVGALLFEPQETPHAEAYRVLRTNILFSRKDDSLNTVTVVSGGVGEGKSTTLLNLATIFAQNGDRVLVVDSDLRRPSLHKVLKVSNALGLTNYLLRQNTLEEVIQTTPLATLDFLPSGKLPSSSMGILSSEQMKNLIAELKRRYDFVFFDSPPIMGVSDASILASEVDMTVQVIQYRRYPQPMTIRAKQMIQKVGGNLVGIVLNNINMSSDESYYYYSGYYHDYYSSKQDDETGVKRRKSSASEQASLDIKSKY